MMSNGSLRSKAMLYCWMTARSRPLPDPGNASVPKFGDRMKTFLGSFTLPELKSGIRTVGIPFARLVIVANGSAELLKLMSYGNDPRMGRDQGSGLMVRPEPARTTDFSPRRYATPRRGARYQVWSLRPTSSGTLPRPPSNTV